MENHRPRARVARLSAPQGSGTMARRPLWLRFLIPARPGSGRTLCVATRPSLGSLPGGRLLLTAAQDEGLCHRPPQEWQAGSLPLRGAWSGELCPQPRPQASPVPSRSNAEMDPATLTPRCGLPRVRACCPAKPHAGSCPCQEEARLGAAGPWPRFPDSCCLCPLGLRAGRPCRGKLRFRAGTSSHTTPRPSKYSQHSWAQLHSESLTRAHLSHHWSLGRVTLREGTLYLGHFTSPSRGWRQRATSAWGWGLPPARGVCVRATSA